MRQDVMVAMRAMVWTIVVGVGATVWAQPGGEGPPSPGEVHRMGTIRFAKSMKQVPAGYLGVSVAPAGPAMSEQLGLPPGVGLAVVDVTEDSPASKAELKRHDVLHKLDDQVLVNPEQLRVLVQNHKEGDEVTLTVIRQGKPVEVKATVAEKLVPEAQRWGGMMMVPGAGEPFRFFQLAKPPMRHRGGHGPGEHDRSGDRPDRPGENDAPPPPPGGPEGEGPGAWLELDLLDGPVVLGSGGAGGGEAGPVARYTDKEFDVTLELRDGEKFLTAVDADGTKVFEGTVEEAADRAGLSDELRARLNRLESRWPVAPATGTATWTGGDL